MYCVVSLERRVTKQTAMQKPRKQNNKKVVVWDERFRFVSTHPKNQIEISAFTEKKFLGRTVIYLNHLPVGQEVEKWYQLASKGTQLQVRRNAWPHRPHCSSSSPHALYPHLSHCHVYTLSTAGRECSTVGQDQELVGRHGLRQTVCVGPHQVFRTHSISHHTQVCSTSWWVLLLCFAVSVCALALVAILL